MNKIYKVADGHTAWHSKEEKYYVAGQVIDLSHLDELQLAAVLASGVVIEAKDNAEAKGLVKHGKTDTDEKDSTG